MHELCFDRDQAEKERDEARGRIAELERQLEEAKADRLNADRRIENQRKQLTELEAIYRQTVGSRAALETLYRRENERKEDAEAICADLLNIVREEKNAVRIRTKALQQITELYTRADGERDTLLETVATQADAMASILMHFQERYRLMHRRAQRAERLLKLDHLTGQVTEASYWRAA